MSVFAKRLKYYIENSGQTIYSVAITSGVERTMIHRMMKGDRIPTNKNVVMAVARTLLLSPSDTDDLMTAYEISRRGESAYRQLQHVQQLLLDCVKPSLLTINPIHPPRKFVLRFKNHHFQSERSPANHQGKTACKSACPNSAGDGIAKKRRPGLPDSTARLSVPV